MIDILNSGINFFYKFTEIEYLVIFGVPEIVSKLSQLISYVLISSPKGRKCFKIKFSAHFKR